MDQNDNTGAPHTGAPPLNIDQIVRRFAYEMECILVKDTTTVEECNIDKGEARFLLQALKKALGDRPNHEIFLLSR